MVRCAGCGEENPDRARFCWSCGSTLGAEPLAQTEERKVVSVLFVDLVGFTARAEKADPEDVRATLRVYHDRLKREIERFGGTVEKFVGDAVMAVFGAPVAREDDAERAVRAGLRIAQAIEELNEERPGLDLEIRAAVNTGEAVVTIGARPEAGEGIVAGDVVNVASRLQNVAPPGALVVGEQTRRATQDSIDYEALEAVGVKGKDLPVEIWRALEARSRFGIDVEQRARAPLVGRAHELDLLTHLFGRVTRDATTHLVTLVGEPGVGKSRLVWEFQRHVDDLPDLITWRQGRCLPYGEGITFWALGEVVKSHAGILESDPPDEALGKLRRAVSIVVEAADEHEWITAALAPLVGLSRDVETAERNESFAAWRAFLEAVASSHPLVLVFEDLHWADPAMLEFIEHLADWATGVPLLVLCTARPELYEQATGWGGGTRNHTAISLSPLSLEETTQLIGELLDRAVLPAETQSALLARAGGNPLYAEEFVRMLIDRGRLVRRGGSWDLTSGDDPIDVPETVHALIAARLDTLPADRKVLLQNASVIGKVFWAGPVAEMAGVDAGEVREGLHELTRKELLRPARRSSIEGEAEYAFRHALIRDVSYGQIPRSSRAAKHVAAAAWIERVAGDRVADSAELLAHHTERALELTEATGGATGTLEAQARRFVMLAAERAIRLDADMAASFVERAMALTEPGGPDRLRALMLAGILALSGRSRELSEDVLREAVDEARATGDAAGEAEALAWLSRLAWMQGNTDRQLELLTQAETRLEGEPPGYALAVVLTRLVAASGLAGRSSETLSRAERALPIAREFGTEHDLAVILQMRGQARIDLGDVAGGLKDAQEGLRIAIQSSPAGHIAAAYVNVGDHLWFTEGPAEGQRLYETAADLADRRGVPRAADWARMQTMWTRYDLGDWDEVVEIGDHVLVNDPGGRDSLSDQLSVLANTYRGDVLAHRGVQVDEGLVDRLVERAREIGDGQVVVPALRLAALRRLVRGDAGGALELVSEVDALLSDRPGFRSWLLDWAAPACRTAGAVDLLRSLIERGVEHMTRDANSVLAAQAVLAEAEEAFEVAVWRYEDAADRWADFPSVLEHGHALAGLGRCRLALGQPDQAAAALRGARERYGALGARPLVATVDELLAGTTAKSS
jgi:class 3 adenylate cyclase/tetratricopeptide (TPR) repeat protein